MPIDSANQWKQKIKKHGGTERLVRNVDVAKLLDRFERAGASSRGVAQMLAQLPTIVPLQDGLRKYRAALPPGNNPLSDYVDEQLDSVTRQIRQGESMNNPAQHVRESLDALIAGLKRQVARPDARKYQDLWQEHVRGLDTALQKLEKLDPRIGSLRSAWSPYFDEKWSARGENVTKGVDPASDEGKERLQAAAKELGTMAMQIKAQLTKQHYLA